MKKVISVLLAVLCLALVVTTTVYAATSFVEGGVTVVAGAGTTVDASYTGDTGSSDVNTLVGKATVTVADLEGAGITGFPSSSSYDVTVVGNFFDVTGTPAAFTVESDKIVAGVQVAVAHYQTAAPAGWEFKAATSVDTTNHTATFSLTSGSPVILVVYKAKTTPASGVVNTATK